MPVFPNIQTVPQGTADIPASAPMPPAPSFPVTNPPTQQPLHPALAQDLLDQMAHHLDRARQLHDQRSAATPPTMEHHKTNLGIYALEVLLSALDPTHQAGTNFANSYEQQRAQQDMTANQNAAQVFGQKQAGLGEQAKSEEMAAGLLGKQASDTRTGQAKADSELLRTEMAAQGLDLKGQLADLKSKEDTRARSDNTHKEFQSLWDSARAHIDHADPTERKFGVDHMEALLKDPKFKKELEDRGTYDLYKGQLDTAKGGLKTKNTAANQADISMAAGKANADSASTTAQLNKALLASKTQEGKDNARLASEHLHNAVLEGQKLTTDLKTLGLKNQKELEKLDQDIARSQDAILKGNDADARQSAATASANYKAILSGLQQDAREYQATMKKTAVLAAADPDSKKAYDTAKDAYDKIQAKISDYRVKLKGIADALLKVVQPPKVSNSLDPANPAMVGNIGGGFPGQVFDRAPIHRNAPAKSKAKKKRVQIAPGVFVSEG